jgi:UPF0755 protein
MTRRWLAALVTVVTVGCAPSRSDSPNRSVQVTIPRGATLVAAAESLDVHGVIESATLFRFYATMTGRERTIQAGTYDFPASSTVREALRILVSGRPAESRLVVPEGLTLQEVAAAIERQLAIPADSILEAARDSTLRARLETPAATLEGYLYPSTYLVPTDAGATDVIRQMVAEFERRWRPEWTAQLDSLGMSRYEIVTLASIIEGEVRYGPDRVYVASVYHNRLRSGMRLQADPTVAYAIGRRRRLFEKDYQTPSPYNTYVVDGLPPGPIGGPSEASLEAALYPARTQFLYFVARPDGQHVFSRTYREHLRAIGAIRGPDRGGPSG